MQMDKWSPPSNIVHLKKANFQVGLLMMGSSVPRCRQSDNFQVSAQGHPLPHPVGQCQCSSLAILEYHALLCIFNTIKVYFKEDWFVEFQIEAAVFASAIQQFSNSAIPQFSNLASAIQHRQFGISRRIRYPNGLPSSVLCQTNLVFTRSALPAKLLKGSVFCK